MTCGQRPWLATTPGLQPSFQQSEILRRHIDDFTMIAKHISRVFTCRYFYKGQSKPPKAALSVRRNYRLKHIRDIGERNETISWLQLVSVAMLSVRSVYSGVLFMDCPTKKGGHKASTYRQIE
jgi:hypothetical protein